RGPFGCRRGSGSACTVAPTAAAARRRHDHRGRTAVPDNLAPVIAATTKWLVGAYPAAGDALSAMLAETQARQAVTVAAFLRYPTPVDTAIVVLVGPGGAAEL